MRLDHSFYQQKPLVTNLSKIFKLEVAIQCLSPTGAKSTAVEMLTKVSSALAIQIGTGSFSQLRLKDHYKECKLFK